MGDTQNAADARRGPLNDIVVLDLTRVLAGPFCAMVLADLGARVIKIESPRGDDSRGFGPFVDGESAYFASLNRGKQSIVLDLKADGDRVIFERLLARADVLLENFRPGTMARLGYGWDVLHARHPRLIYAAVSGFGHTGPHRGRPAYDMVAQAMGGIMSLTGTPGGPPVRVGTSIGDITAALFAATAINAALHERHRTGGGAMVDVAMLDSQIAILENALARYFATGVSPAPLGTTHPSITPFDMYSTADGYIVLAAGNDALFATLCDVLDRPDLKADPRFATNGERNRHVAAISAALAETLKARTTAEWLERLQAAGVPCGPINDVAAAVADPQVVARNMVVETVLGGGSALRIAGNPMKLSTHPDPSTRGPVPRLDGDRAAILAELGMDDPD